MLLKISTCIPEIVNIKGRRVYTKILNQYNYQFQRNSKHNVKHSFMYSLS